MRPDSFLISCIALVFAACAGQTVSVHAGPSFASARGGLAIADGGGALPPASSVDGDLDLGDAEVSPYVQAQVDADGHRFRVSGLLVGTDGQGTLGDAFGDLPGGSQVQTLLDFLALVGNYSYELLREEHYRVGVGAQLGFYSLDVGATAGGSRESFETQGLLPMPYAEVEAFYGDLTFGLSGGAMAGNFGDSDGRYLDLEAYATWLVDDCFDVRGGYRYLVLDGEGRATDRDFDADLEVRGFFVTAGVRF